jgi:hypothetical protein
MPMAGLREGRNLIGVLDAFKAISEAACKVSYKANSCLRGPPPRPQVVSLTPREDFA